MMKKPMKKFVNGVLNLNYLSHNNEKKYQNLIHKMI